MWRSGVDIVHPGWAERDLAPGDHGAMPSPRSTTTARRAGRTLALGALACATARLAGRALAVGALACAAATPAAHAANTTLAVEQRATPVAAWQGTIAWSSFDRATGEYRLLVSRDGGPPRPVAVAPSPVPFDVDLGTNRAGSTYAVYTRCATPAPAGAQDARGTDCDVFRTSIDTGRETRLQSISAPAWDEREPTIMRGQIAFIRRETYGGRTQDVLRVATTPGLGGTHALVRTAVRDGALSDPELSDDRVAFVRSDSGRYGFGEQVVRTMTLRTHRLRTHYTARSGGANFANIAGLSVSDTLKSFVWARTNQGSGTGNRLVRLTISDGRLTYAQGSSLYVSSAWASPALGAAVMYDGSGTGTCFGNIDDPPERTACSVQVTGPVTWFARP